MSTDLQARVAALAERSKARQQANRERWPEFAEFVDGFTAVFGRPAGIVTPDGAQWGKPAPQGRAVITSAPWVPLKQKGAK